MVIRRAFAFGLLRSAIGFTLAFLMALFVAACGGGGDTPAAALNPPSLTAQPAAQTALDGATATFAVAAAASSTPLTYQWRKNGVNINGANGPSINVAAPYGDNNARFSVVVSNAEGSVTSAEALLMVTPRAPSIIAQPLSVTVQSGSAATISAVVSGGTAPVTFQWRRNGVNIVGATQTTYTIASTGITDNAAVFTLAVVNPSGTLLSSAATLTVTAAASLSLHAGDMSGLGYRDATGPEARFSNPWDIATDSAGNVYVADTWNWVIRKITPAGVVTTVAGRPPYAGGDKLWTFPTSVGTDSAGNIYVIEGSTVFKSTPAGVVTTFVGIRGVSGSADGTGTAPSFAGPDGFATDGADNLYVSDTYNHTIRKITPAGVVTTIAGTAGLDGSADGTGAEARFFQPHGITTDRVGNLYVADWWNCIVRKITPSGVVTTLAGTAGRLGIGSTDGTGAAAKFKCPDDVATDSAGNVYVADRDNHTIRKITPAGVVTTLAGTAGLEGSTDGTGAAARFSTPMGIATDSADNVYVLDYTTSIIRKITPAGVTTTLAGVAPQTGSIDATGAAARFNSPACIATDSVGNAYVTDSGNHTIRKITPSGLVTTLAGAAGQIGSTDATGAAARFSGPDGIATDGAGNVYVADSGNHTIRKISPAGVVTTLAGEAGQVGSTDGTGAAARFRRPTGVATDGAANVYVTDKENYTIRKITTAGVVTTVAGTAGSRGWAGGLFESPHGLAIDSAGNVYVSDFGSYIIHKITPAGLVTTLAGNPGQPGSINGTGPTAYFDYPRHISIDGAGNLYVPDWGSGTIRKVTPAGVVTTVVGMPERQDFMPGALPGLLGFPKAVAVSGTSLYIVLYEGVAVVQNRP